MEGRVVYRDIESNIYYIKVVIIYICKLLGVRRRIFKMKRIRFIYGIFII